jgi:hypothetical protein
MYRRVVFAAVAAVLATGGSGLSEDKVPASQPQSSWPPIVIQVKDRAELIEKFCAADSNLETVVLPASLFVDAKRMLCDSGPYTTELSRLPTTSSTFWIRRSMVRPIDWAATVRPEGSRKSSPATADIEVKTGAQKGWHSGCCRNASAFGLSPIRAR